MGLSFINMLGLSSNVCIAHTRVACYWKLFLFSQSQSHIATDGQSVCLSWCRAHDQILITVWQLLSCPWEDALSDERTGLSFISHQLSVCTISTFYMCHMLLNTYTIYTRPLSVRAHALCTLYLLIGTDHIENIVLLLLQRERIYRAVA
jgi:hypothetical protein